MKVLVCGGRDFKNAEFLYKTLENLHKKNKFTLIIEGNAQGADRLAGCWAEHMNLRNRKFLADWDKYGRTAGHIRNRRMLDEGKPDLVVAFPGGSGTANMIELAWDAGIPIVKLDEAGNYERINNF